MTKICGYYQVKEKASARNRRSSRAEARSVLVSRLLRRVILRAYALWFRSRRWRKSGAFCFLLSRVACWLFSLSLLSCFSGRSFFLLALLLLCFRAPALALVSPRLCTRDQPPHPHFFAPLFGGFGLSALRFSELLARGFPARRVGKKNCTA